jgi:HlyD family type I secretion membrane fusion protein
MLNLPAAATTAPDRPRYGRAILFGGVVVVLFFGVFMIWASVAPLDSAAVAGGTVIVDSKRKTVQHFEGGIIGEILVRDGDRVEAGQVLVLLDDTQPRASLDLLKGRQMAAMALSARLVAERDNRAEIEFSDELMDDLDTFETLEAIAGQTNLFNARREGLTGQVDILDQRMAQTRDEIVGLEGEVAASVRQLDLIGQEIADVQTLVDQGLARRPRLLELERQAASIEGRRSSNIAGIARARNQIGEAKLQIRELRKQRTNEVLEQLREVQTELYDIAERMSAAKDVLARMTIRASGGTDCRPCCSYRGWCDCIGRAPHGYRAEE